MKKKKPRKCKKTYSTRCNYPDCLVKYSEKGLSFHQLPKNASQEQIEKWTQILGGASSSSEIVENPHLGRICSKHFKPEDFERDLRNEMLGLPLRNLLKSGSVPMSPESYKKAGLKINTPTLASKVVEKPLKMPECPKLASQISREVDLLTEIAELQQKLIEKLGKKADLSLYQNALSGSSNHLKISKESLVKSIKDEVYGRTNHANNLMEIAERNNIHLITNSKDSIEIPNRLSEFKEFLGLDEETDCGPLVIFDWKGHQEFKQSIVSTSQRIKELRSLEPTLKESAKSEKLRVRQKMVLEGEKNLQKRQADIESYKLKVVELKLWKRKWVTKQRSLRIKTLKRKEKVAKRRQWINEQIDKGFMHKSCKVLIHSRAKFPFESGFEAAPAAAGKNNKNKKLNTTDNQAALISGVHVASNGMVYPCKKSNDQQSFKKTKKKDQNQQPALEQQQQEVLMNGEIQVMDNEEQHYVQFAFTDEDGNLLHAQDATEVYIHDNFITGSEVMATTADDNGTIIHII